MSEKTVEFAFEVGEFVTLKGLLLLDPVPVAVPVLQIVESLSQECPGGTQRHYACRVMSYDGKQGSFFNHEYHRLNEIELSPWSEYKKKRQVQRDEVEKIRIRTELLTSLLYDLEDRVEKLEFTNKSKDKP